MKRLPRSSFIHLLFAWMKTENNERGNPRLYYWGVLLQNERYSLIWEEQNLCLFFIYWKQEIIETVLPGLSHRFNFLCAEELMHGARCRSGLSACLTLSCCSFHIYLSESGDSERCWRSSEPGRQRRRWWWCHNCNFTGNLEEKSVPFQQFLHSVSTSVSSVWRTDHKSCWL